ncbi:hypothetical protein PACTADRAFT_48268 [Pachysolen tannophilus NRRL Y-2460]|uniref:DnaJ homologue subfamily C member 28 conserved domain-containing protein n=1 Tax=Pachysolen tannophilus NRRL Y-2460 TaxID=669874 RepID=A0A1E4U3E5_PACTA|nr:hypothetical protein PACTADRAFT_48268 [Pachysolen tannophilus NRRL Y-2460]
MLSRGYRIGWRKVVVSRGKLRFSSTKQITGSGSSSGDSGSNNGSNDSGNGNFGNDDHQDDSYMKRRLQQLAEDATPIRDDPSIGIPQDALPYNQIITKEPNVFKNNNNDTEKSLMESDPNLQKIISNLEQASFDQKYQREIGVSKIKSYVNKHSRDLALHQPWSGKESQQDSTLRMLIDKHKPLSITKKNGDSLITPKLPNRERINHAREKSLDYLLSKHEIKEKTPKAQDDKWREQYKERLLGPEMFIPTSFSNTVNAYKAVADQRIDEAKRRGDFENLPNRGKPFKKDSHSSSAYIDRTEYHLNNILKRQDIVPPWIEKQSSVEVVIRNFRDSLDKDWLKRGINLICEKYPNKSLQDQSKIIEQFAIAESQDNGAKLRDKHWEDQQLSYLNLKIQSLNDTIRGYNLQAPLASQKMYLTVERELKNMYKRINRPEVLNDALKNHVIGDKDNHELQKKKSQQSKLSQNKYLAYNELPQQPTQGLGSLFLNIFKKSNSERNY